MGWSIHHPVGLLHCTPAACQRGYTLFATTRGGRDAYLIDLRGNVVHRWHSEEGIHYACLLDNGNLLCRIFPILTRVIQWQCQLACRCYRALYSVARAYCTSSRCCDVGISVLLPDSLNVISFMVVPPPRMQGCDSAVSRQALVSPAYWAVIA